MSATDVPCPVCNKPRDEPCPNGRVHKPRVKLARELRRKMDPPWKPGGRRGER